MDQNTKLSIFLNHFHSYHKIKDVESNKIIDVTSVYVQNARERIFQQSENALRAIKVEIIDIDIHREKIVKEFNSYRNDCDKIISKGPRLEEPDLEKVKEIEEKLHVLAEFINSIDDSLASIMRMLLELYPEHEIGKPFLDKFSEYLATSDWLSKRAEMFRNQEPLSFISNKMTKEAKHTIQKFISSGDIALALDTLLSMELPPNDKSAIIQIKASYEQLRKDSIRGVLSFEQQTTEQNRINDRLLKFLDSGETDSETSDNAPVKREWKKYVAVLVAIITALAGIAELSGYSLRDLFSGSGTNNTFTVTVFVHGKKGKDERVLKNQGQVMLGLRTNEMPGSINEKGEATFKEIPMGFKGEKVPIRIEHPQPYRATHPDSLYLIEPNAAIFVEVALEGTNVIKGKVMDFYTEQWLDSVRVSVENVATYTDQFGWFELEIPENKQRKFQRVSFFKKGYEIDELDSIPVHTQQEIHISLRKSTKR